jgi:hypothetical protein
MDIEPFLKLLQRLNDNQVDYVLVGGMAAMVHGADITTQDVDVCTSMSPENVQKIIKSMDGLNAYWSRRPGPPLMLERTLDQLENVKNIYLETPYGRIDFLGELPQVGDFEYAKKHSSWLNVIPEFRCRVLDIDPLIACKKAANRSKDIPAIYHLMALRDSLFYNPRPHLGEPENGED